jgi:hypothetical protein
MKKLIYSMFLFLAAGALFTGCQGDKGNEGDEGKNLSSDTTIKSVTAYADNDTRGQDILDISFSADRKTITFTTRALPDTDEPVDMANVHISMTFAEGATSDLSTGTYDLTKSGNTVTVTAEDKKTTNVVQLVGVVTPPYEVIPEYNTSVTQVWTKTGTELALKCPQSIRGGIAVAGDKLYIMDSGLDHNPDTYKIKAYDKMTGAYSHDIGTYEGGWWGVAGYMGALASDDAGNFGNCRLDEAGAGAGFWLDLYNSEEAYSQPIPLINGELTGMGRRLQLLGDITGTGKIITTAGSLAGGNSMTAEYTVWNVTDGVAGAYSKLTFGTNLLWKSAFVQQASLDDNTLYVSYNDEPNYPNDPFDTWETVHGGHFVVYDPSSGLPQKSIADENFMYRILNHNVFKLNGRTFLFTLEQGYSTGTGAVGVKLFDITDPENYDMKPGDEGYDKFRVFASEPAVISNDLRLGNVTTWVDEVAGEAYLVVFYPAGPTTYNPGTAPMESDAKVVVYKVTTEEV